MRSPIFFTKIIKGFNKIDFIKSNHLIPHKQEEEKIHAGEYVEPIKNELNQTKKNK
jgi:hypothetical protein